MVDGVKAMGYIEPTPIQLRAIPLILAGQDVIGSAADGDGQDGGFCAADSVQTGTAWTGTAGVDSGTDHGELAAQVGNGHS